LEDIIRDCIDEAGCSCYEIEDFQDDENIFILHASQGFLTPDLTEKLRNHLIFVDASGGSRKDYQASFFLNYLEGREDTFMDNLANPVSTDKTLKSNTEGDA